MQELSKVDKRKHQNYKEVKKLFAFADKYQLYTKLIKINKTPIQSHQRTKTFLPKICKKINADGKRVKKKRSKQRSNQTNICHW